MASLAAIGNDLYWGKRSFPFVGKRKVWYTVALLCGGDQPTAGGHGGPKTRY